MVVSARNTGLVLLALLGVGLSACAASKSNTGSNSSGTAATGANSGTGTGGSGTTATPMSGASNASDTKPVGTDLTVASNPMYSGYDGMRTFKLPAIVPGLTGVQWSSSDSSYVSL